MITWTPIADVLKEKQNRIKTLEAALAQAEHYIDRQRQTEETLLEEVKALQKRVESDKSRYNEMTVRKTEHRLVRLNTRDFLQITLRQAIVMELQGKEHRQIVRYLCERIEHIVDEVIHP